MTRLWSWLTPGVKTYSESRARSCGRGWRSGHFSWQRDIRPSRIAEDPAHDRAGKIGSLHLISSGSDDCVCPTFDSARFSMECVRFPGLESPVAGAARSGAIAPRPPARGEIGRRTGDLAAGLCRWGWSERSSRARSGYQSARSRLRLDRWCPLPSNFCMVR